MEPQLSTPRESGERVPERIEETCPCQVDVGRQRDGWVFALEPRTVAAIVKRFPGSCRVTSVFVGTRETDDFFNQPDRLPDTLVRVIELLSGLTFDELSPLGVFRAFDPVEDRVLVTTEPGSAAFDDWRRPRVPKE